MSGLTIDDPVKFIDVLRSKNIKPGDVLLLRGGTYTGIWDVNIGGTDGAPVVIKPYPGESVTIDGGFRFGKPYVTIQDLEITESTASDGTDHNNMMMGMPGIWIIGCHIYNVKGNGVEWFGSGPGGVVECWIHDNGYRDAQNVGNCHAIYTHNHLGGTRLIARNLMNDQVGKYTIQIYSGGGNYLRDYICEDNVIRGDPVHTGGGLGLKDFVYRRNIQMQDYCQHGRYAFDHGWNENGQIIDNLFIGLIGYTVNLDCSYEWLNLTESGNIVWKIGDFGEPSNRPGYTVEPTPTTWSRFVPFTLSERWAGIQATLVDGIFNAEIVNK